MVMIRMEGTRIITATFARRLSAFDGWTGIGERFSSIGPLLPTTSLHSVTAREKDLSELEAAEGSDGVEDTLKSIARRSLYSIFCEHVYLAQLL